VSVRNNTFFEDLADGKLSLDKVPAWAWYLMFLLVCYLGYLLRLEAASHARADQFLIDHGIPPRLR
jgi:hypothetical protein